MTNKQFDQLPTKKVEVKGLPKTTLDDLPSYYQALGDGSRQYLGIETGISELDRATMGLSGVILLGGVPGVGKTSYALQVAYEACKKGTPVIFYSLEMPKVAIYTKILNRLSRVGYRDILLKGRPYLNPEAQEKDLMGNEVDYKNLFTKDEVEALKQAQQSLVKIGDRFYTRTREDKEEINFNTLEAEINLVKGKHQTDKVLVVIDHLQVFTLEDKTMDQIQKEGKLIDGFKGVSERTTTPVILISQNNKEGVKKDGTKYNSSLSNIKGSVDLIYLADIVMFIDRPEEDENEKIFNNGLKKVVLDVKKNRYGSTTKINYMFDLALS